MQWQTLFHKEILENWRNYNWIWVPLVIVILAIMDPITNYYLPEIIEAVGGVPEGAVFEIPTPTPVEAMMMSLSQLSTLGVLVFILISMGTIAGERKSGIAEVIFTKPLSFKNYITAKWVSWISLSWLSLLLGLTLSWYYITILYGNFSFSAFLQVFLFYGIWYMFVITISIFYNTWLKTPGLVVFLTIATLGLLHTITSIFDHVLTWSPMKISTYIHETLVYESIQTDLIATAIVTIGLMIILLIIAVVIMDKKEIIHK